MSIEASTQSVDIQGLSEPEYITVNGLKTAYRRSGTGEPLVFLHGMGLANSWLKSHALMAEHFDVIAPQHPGFGRTPRPAWYRSLDDSVAHYADVLDALGVSRAHLVGHSFGGLFGAAFAATYPERILSLTLVAPLPLPVVRPSSEEGSHEGEAPPNLMELLFNESFEQYSEYDPPEDLGLFVDEPDDEFSDPSAWKFDPAPGLYRRLSRITAPRQILLPDRDQVIGETTGADWSRWADAPIVTISGASASTGHMLTEQETEKYVGAIVALSQRAKG
ncbi:alpha/beta fold hydrolase [Microbacterium sp. A8/3-1]|uniref:Alpha/beta fold hydrolase n=1 Tax=Microbacterium sp. A8/3-1 TaxID=3160749 RepID=A0AAU7VXB0_9MICO